MTIKKKMIIVKWTAVVLAVISLGFVFYNENPFPAGWGVLSALIVGFFANKVEEEA